MFRAAEPGFLFTSNTGTDTRFLNSIAALIVPGNCTVEASHSAKQLASVQREGRAHYNRPHWDHYQFMPVALHFTADSRERALHQLDKRPTSPAYYQATLAWQPACNLSRWTRLLHCFASLLPQTAATVTHDASAEFLAWSPFWQLLKLALSWETWHWLRRSCVFADHRNSFFSPRKLLDMAFWQKYVTSRTPLRNALSSLLTSCCLPAHLCLWNEEVLHMVSMTGKIIKTLM